MLPGLPLIQNETFCFQGHNHMIDHNRLFTTFMELCAIDSEPTCERLMADRLTEKLTSLGFVVSEDDTGKKIGGSAGNLYARLEGTTVGEVLLFSCHMDRVVPGVNVKPRIEGDYIVSDGSTVLGADDASGLAALLEGMYEKLFFKHRSILNLPQCFMV
jgi:tripeptide aminopeptidase